MYHQITSNKRKSIIVVVGFLAVWLLAGLVIGEIGTGSTGGAIAGTVVLGLLGAGAALYAYYFGAPTVLFELDENPHRMPRVDGDSSGEARIEVDVGAAVSQYSRSRDRSLSIQPNSFRFTSN